MPTEEAIRIDDRKLDACGDVYVMMRTLQNNDVLMLDTKTPLTFEKFLLRVGAVRP